jgi:hypothetical protein
MGWFFRNPRTQQERRANGNREFRRVEIQVGGETLAIPIRIRGKRSQRMLVTAYDDLPRERQRSWKKHRWTQYKARDMLPVVPPSSDDQGARS